MRWRRRRTGGRIRYLHRTGLVRLLRYQPAPFFGFRNRSRLHSAASYSTDRASAKWKRRNKTKLRRISEREEQWDLRSSCNQVYLENVLHSSELSAIFYYRLLRRKGSIKHSRVSRQIYRQACRVKIIKSHQNHASQRAAEKFSNTAYFIASTPSYEHRPHFERRALRVFLFK